jgi:CPA1 family monovalent cation:H+ antiporter
MSIAVVILLALIALLGAAAFAVPLARKLGQPVAVLLAALGLAHGLTTSVFGVEIFRGALDTYDQWFVEQLALDSQALLYFFLPPLLFEMTLAVNVRRLLEDSAAVLAMAVLAVVAATGAIGVMLWLASPMALLACLLVGAAVATTDPGAVISTFREIGAPRRLLTILEGESLLNDAAAITIFGLLLAVMRQEAEPSASGLLTGFLYSFGSGAAVGWGIAVAASRIYPLLVRSTVAEATITVIVAYGAFITAEQLFGGSGVVAVVFAGLTTGWAGFMRMGPGNWQTVRAVWAQIGFWANALIMMIATSLVPGLIGELGWLIAPLTLLVYLCAMAARALILFGLLPLMAALRLTAPLTRPQSYLVVWGGVRGSVTLVLAISIADMTILGPDARTLAAIAASYTLATVFLNASTLAWLMRKLGLNRLSATDLALREKIVAGVLERVRTVVGNMVRARHLEPDALLAVEAALGAQQEQAAALAEAQAGGERIPFGERLRLGLTILRGQETRLIRQAFDEGAIGPRAAGRLRLDADRIADAARLSGREGYQAAAKDALRPAPAYRVAIYVQRYLKFEAPLRTAIELQFIALLESERVTRELARFAETTMLPMIGDDAAANLVQLMQARHADINTEINVIGAQYPNYASAVERTLIANAALRRERQQYRRLLQDGVIGQELHDSLSADLDSRERAAAKPPRLDLTLMPLALLCRVPLFEGLDPKQRRKLARAFRTRFTTPGEEILSAGERGAAMYFVASGALEIRQGSNIQRLGTGEFFGELALIHPLRRRLSSVHSSGYCRLLVLKRRDFKRLAKRDPTIESLIRGSAEGRLTPPEQPVAPLPDAAVS